MLTKWPRKGDENFKTVSAVEKHLESLKTGAANSYLNSQVLNMNLGCDSENCNWIGSYYPWLVVGGILHLCIFSLPL